MHTIQKIKNFDNKNYNKIISLGAQYVVLIYLNHLLTQMNFL